MPMTSVVADTAPAQREYMWFAGSLVHFKATSEQTGNDFMLLEVHSPRGKTTPLHTHPEQAESLYVIEGELLVHVDGREHTASAGDFVAIPRGVAHAFMVVSQEARYLGMLTPGNPASDAFYRQAGDPVDEPKLPPSGEPDIPRIKSAAQDTGAIEVLGPPPFALARA
jgi:quercetin dioxygenase-like cupin family protein